MDKRFPISDFDIVSASDPGNIRTLGQARNVPSVAAWSADGSLLAFVDSGSKFIQIMTPQGGIEGTVGLADNAADEPAWSTDSQHLAYVQGGGIWTAGRDGLGPTRLTNDQSYTDRDPQWSSDGSRIVFVRLNGDAQYQPGTTPTELWIMNADGSEAQKLVDLPEIDLATQSFSGWDIDWDQYFSWYRPNGTGPLPIPTNPPGYPTFPAGSPTPLQLWLRLARSPSAFPLARSAADRRRPRAIIGPWPPKRPSGGSS